MNGKTPSNSKSSGSHLVSQVALGGPAGLKRKSRMSLVESPNSVLSFATAVIKSQPSAFCATAKAPALVPPWPYAMRDIGQVHASARTGHEAVQVNACPRVASSNNEAGTRLPLSLRTAVLVSAKLEARLRLIEHAQEQLLRSVGVLRSPDSDPSSLDLLAKHSLSAFVRRHHISLADTVRLLRGETSADTRPNKAMDEARVRALLTGYEHAACAVDVIKHGIQPRWSARLPQLSRPHRNHQSFQRSLKVVLRSIREGQDAGKYMVVDGDLEVAWPELVISPLGAVEKSGVDPSIEVRLIHDLSFPPGMSTNSHFDKACAPIVQYDYVTKIAERILEVHGGGHQVKMLKGDVKGAFRHLMLHADHVHWMAARIPECDALVIDLSAPFGWSGSPPYYGAFGRGISWLVQRNSPASVSESTDAEPFWAFEWVDDHILVEADRADRLTLAEATLRHSMIALLGPRSINDKKFSAWSTRLQALGLIWDTEQRTVSMPADKIAKCLARIDALLARLHATKSDLMKALGSLRHLCTCLPATRPFYQALQWQCNKTPRFGKVPITEGSKRDLEWFSQILKHGRLADLPLELFTRHPTRPDIHLYMDASDVGAAVLSPATSEYIQQAFDDSERAAMRDDDATNSFSINVREHLCIAWAIWTWGPFWAAQDHRRTLIVQCWSDNSSAVAWANRRYSPNALSQEVNRAIGLAEAIFDVRVQVGHLPGATNTAADMASRAWTHPYSAAWTNFAVHWRQSQSLASSSRKKYASTWQQWRRWCSDAGLHVWLPQCQAAHSHQLALFAARCWNTGWSSDGRGNSAATVLAKVSHVSWYHQRMLGYAVGLSPAHRLAVAGMRRIGASPTRKSPVTTELLKSMHRSLDFTSTHDRVLWGAAVMGFFFLMRRSEYLAQGSKCQSFILTRSDVRFYDNSGHACAILEKVAVVSVTFRGSKTDQFKEGTTRHIGRSGSAWLCPVLAAWFLAENHARLGLQADRPLCATARDAVLQVRAMTTLIKKAATRIGEDPARYGTHSLRSGGATALFSAGVDSLVVKQFGRWRSDAFERYTRLDARQTRTMAHAMIAP